MQSMNASEKYPAAIEAIGLTKKYSTGGDTTLALGGVSFAVERGDFVAIIGPSGSGKTTLLNLLGALDRPTSGGVLIDGIDISRLSNAELAKTRNKKIGFVFQDFNLLSRMSAVENVELPLMINGTPREKRHELSMSLLDRFGLSSKANRNVNKLSGGERQRVAVARALGNNPSIILADEPTGNLDTRNTAVMMEFMKKLNKEFGKTVVIITHNPDLANKAKRIIAIRDGVIEREVRNN